jgi:hypothetical protein
LHGIAPVVRLQRLQVGIDPSIVYDQESTQSKSPRFDRFESGKKKDWKVWMSSVRVVSGKKIKRQIGLVKHIVKKKILE